MLGSNIEKVFEWENAVRLPCSTAQRVESTYSARSINEAKIEAKLDNLAQTKEIEPALEKMSMEHRLRKPEPPNTSAKINMTSQLNYVCQEVALKTLKIQRFGNLRAKDPRTGAAEQLSAALRQVCYTWKNPATKTMPKGPLGTNSSG
ncbi:hypothetical protein Q9966_003481 [Columba livia]|nr:hypothetical protein Q9966_003481 [Columba livia]